MAKILVIEDNPNNMKLAVFLLEISGHTVLQATDAKAGINIAKAETPALILMDIQLPGMDGLTATGILKSDSLTRNIKIFALTAFAMKGDDEKFRAAGCDGYIAKPIHHTSFIETIKAAIATDVRAST